MNRAASITTFISAVALLCASCGATAGQSPPTLAATATDTLIPDPPTSTPTKTPAPSSTLTATNTATPTITPTPTPDECSENARSEWATLAGTFNERIKAVVTRIDWAYSARNGAEVGAASVELQTLTIEADNALRRSYVCVEDSDKLIRRALAQYSQVGGSAAAAMNTDDLKQRGGLWEKAVDSRSFAANLWAQAMRKNELKNTPTPFPCSPATQGEWVKAMRKDLSNAEKFFTAAWGAALSGDPHRVKPLTQLEVHGYIQTPPCRDHAEYEWVTTVIKEYAQALVQYNTIVSLAARAQDKSDYLDKIGNYASVGLDHIHAAQDALDAGSG
jgi:hypothetical protein